MLKNYLTTAIRGLIKHKEYSLINILGFSLGLASVFVILLFVNEELNFDRFHSNKDRIYRINIAVTNPQSGEVSKRAVGPYRLAKELKPDFPDIPHIIRFASRGRELVQYKDKIFYEEELVFVDPDVFTVFTFPLLQGDPALALKEPYSVVITEEIATKYFGEEQPIGKTITFRDNDFKVTGIMEPLGKKPLAPTQFNFNMLVSLNAAEQLFSRIVLENWGEGSSETFVLLPEGKDPDDYQQRLAAFVESKLGSWAQFSPRLELQPLTKIYLYSQDIASFVAGGDIIYVYSFSAIALFILIIACINYMNLATARSANRAKEVGLRKVVGAQRFQLIGQFLSESIVLAILAFIFAVILVIFSLPFFNGIANTELTIDIVENGTKIFGLFFITLVVGLLAGSYPALFLSAFKPTSVLSGALKSGVKGAKFRKLLVTFQFTISIFLIVVTIVVNKQIEYARKLKLGFNKENLILLEGNPQSFRMKFDQFRTVLLNHPNILNASASSRVPPGRLRSNIGTRPEGVSEDQRVGMQTVWTYFDFIETMGFEIAAGRSFSRDYSTDGNSAFILNEAAVTRIGWTNESAIGKTFGSSEIKDWDNGQWEHKNGQVIGVLKDVHFESVHQKIVPTVYFIAPQMAWSYVIRIGPDNISETLDFIEKKWTEFNPEEIFLYSFVDERFGNLYRTEERQGRIFRVFEVLVIMVACLGLVGLASFTAEQKTKEVGIRKVVGASVNNIFFLISKEFAVLIFIAFLISSPIAWYFMDNWLQNFAYHTSLHPTVFLLAGFLSLIIFWVTVSYHTIQVALTNPADTLSHE